MFMFVMFQIQRLSEGVLYSTSSLYKDLFQTAMFYKPLLMVVLAVMRLLLILLSSLSAAFTDFFLLTVIHSMIQRESSISHIWTERSSKAKRPGVWKWDVGPSRTGTISRWTFHLQSWIHADLQKYMQTTLMGLGKMISKYTQQKE